MKKVKMFFRFLVVCLVLSALAGCGLFKCKPNIIHDEVTITQHVPEALTKPCTTTVLFNKDAYTKAEPSDQNDIMTGYNLELIAVIKECDSRFSKIKGLNDDKQPKAQ